MIYCKSTLNAPCFTDATLLEFPELNPEKPPWHHERGSLHANTFYGHTLTTP